jgi:hypothetical protein
MCGISDIGVLLKNIWKGEKRRAWDNGILKKIAVPKITHFYL